MNIYTKQSYSKKDIEEDGDEWDCDEWGCDGSHEKNERGFSIHSSCNALYPKLFAPSQ